ncbi:MAG TPA: hypothetical protein VFG19_14370 [Geobacteraceae bacterium]|nr:hypothetical protein [Geobacteraceae bacterium]
MKLAVAGAGMTGAYLYRLLKNEGREVHLYDRQQFAGCGIKPCAWGTSTQFVGLLNDAGLDAEKYILRRLDHILIDDVRVRADIITFDKPMLIRDLLADAEILATPLPIREYDRVVDASGVSRALLPAIRDDFILNCTQYLIETREPLENRIRLGGIGYAWCFPLSPGRFHVGCGSLIEDPRRILKKLGWLDGKSPLYEKKILCHCAGRIRLTGPFHSRPFVVDGPAEGIWGMGEAIGCVAPLAGDGIVPGMRSVQLLLECWDNPHLYENAILDEFSWMKNERAIIDKLRKNGRVGIRDALVLKRNSKRMGMRVGIRDALALLNNLR